MEHHISLGISISSPKVIAMEHDAKSLIIAVTCLIIAIALMPTVILQARSAATVSSTTTSTTVITWESVNDSLFTDNMIQITEVGEINDTFNNTRDTHDGTYTDAVYSIGETLNIEDYPDVHYIIWRSYSRFDMTGLSVNWTELIGAKVQMTATNDNLGDTRFSVIVLHSDITEAPDNALDLGYFNRTFYTVTDGNAPDTSWTGTPTSVNITLGSSALTYIPTVLSDSGFVRFCYMSSRDLNGQAPDSNGESIYSPTATDYPAVLYLGFSHTTYTTVITQNSQNISTMLLLIPLIFVVAIAIWWIKVIIG